MKKKITKEDIYKLVMKKILPRRTIIHKGFCNGKEVEIKRIIYKAGGFDIEKIITNKR